MRVGAGVIVGVVVDVVEENDGCGSGGMIEVGLDGNGVDEIELELQVDVGSGITQPPPPTSDAPEGHDVDVWHRQRKSSVWLVGHGRTLEGQ